ncbi:hypothetical protein M0R04_10005 [Candidatus Dojkabacteria bacterium]|jgi:hypothetical protein|nr:hypothetical protein [Candidatus Dojkabacteria bacterium]
MLTLIHYSNNDDGTRCGYFFEHKGKKYSDICDVKDAKILITKMIRTITVLNGGRPSYRIDEIKWDEFLKKL